MTKSLLFLPSAFSFFLPTLATMQNFFLAPIDAGIIFFGAEGHARNFFSKKPLPLHPQKFLCSRGCIQTVIFLLIFYQILCSIESCPRIELLKEPPKGYMLQSGTGGVVLDVAHWVVFSCYVTCPMFRFLSSCPVLFLYHIISH